jgi:uncharacterized protein
MSEENVKTFKRAYEAGTRPDTEALLDELDPEVEWHAALPALLGGEATVYRGHEGVRDFMREFQEVFAERHMEFDEIRDLGDRLVAIGRLRNRGRASGAEVESPIAYVVDFKRGKVVLVRTYLDHHSALEAAGLSE